MIRLTTCAEELRQAARKDPMGGAAVEALYRCYAGFPFIDFYVWESQGEIIGSACRYDGSLTVCADTADWEEMIEFMTITGGFLAADLPVALAVELQKTIGGTVEQACVMTAEKPLKICTEECRCAEDIYSLNVKAAGFTGEKIPWIADFSHRLRHGSAKAFTVHHHGELAACAALMHIGTDYAVVGYVATLDQYRGKGLGSRCAASAIATAQQLGSTPLLCCEEELKNFYTALGCQQTGTRANYFREQ